MLQINDVVYVRTKIERAKDNLTEVELYAMQHFNEEKEEATVEEKIGWEDYYWEPPDAMIRATINFIIENRVTLNEVDDWYFVYQLYDKEGKRLVSSTEEYEKYF